MSYSFKGAYLSPKVISERLKNAFGDVFVYNDAHVKKISTIGISDENDECDCVVIKDIDALNNHYEEKLVVISGDYRSFACQIGCCIFVLSDPGFEKIYIELQKCLFDFFKWDSNLKSAVLSNAGIMEICKIGYEYLDNPVMIHDNNFVIIAKYGRGESVSDADYNDRLGGYIYQKDRITKWMNDREMKQSMLAKGTAWQKSPRGYDLLFYNITDENRNWAGRIVLLPDNHALTEASRFVFDHFCKIIEFTLKRNRPSANRAVSLLRNELERSLKNKPDSFEDLIEIMTLNGWSQKDHYICAVIKKRTNASISDFDSAILHRIENDLNGTILFALDDNMVAVINCRIVGEDGDMARESFMKQINTDIFCVGFSIMFEGMETLGIAYEQALTAAGYISSKEFEKNFKDVQTKYLASLVKTGKLTRSIIERNLLKLMNYDTQKNAELMETLKIYLASSCNIKVTSAICGINRTTTYYRLEKIQKLTNLSLDDPDNRLLLSILIEAYYS